MNAIILAAGMGKRFNRITRKIHKALLPVGGVPNIERTINYLNEFGVDKVIIVTGYKSESFDYLREKYGCELILNENYYNYNNIYSFYKAINYFNDSFVIDADVVLFENIFKSSQKSFYYTIQRPVSDDLEWVPIVNRQGRVISVDITDDYKPSMLGISYWNSSDCKFIRNNLNSYLDKKTLSNKKLYWDNIMIDLLDRIYVKTVIVPPDSASEMDNMDDYEDICKIIEKRNEKIN